MFGSGSDPNEFGLRSTQGGFYMQGHADSAIFLYGNGYERIQKLYF